MNTHKTARVRARRGGMVYILALVLVTVFSCLAVAMAAMSDLNVRQSDNYRDAWSARMQAEGGLSFLTRMVSQVRLSGTINQGSFPGAMAAALGGLMNGTANLGGQTITVSNNVVCVPTIAAGDGNFTGQIAWSGSNVCTLKVQGKYQTLTRTLSLDFKIQSSGASAFDYGLASRGPISIGGSSNIVGVNNMAEASVISTSAAQAAAITVGGSSNVSGDLSCSGDTTTIVITGNPTVAGSKDPNVIAQHVHIGVQAPDFPATNVSPIAALATYTLQKNDPTTKGTYNNLRIPAGMNPSFASNVVLNGVVYIEAPNNVSFTGGVVLNGLVVTQSNGSPLSACQLFFAGHVEAFGVEALPNTAEFAAVKQQTGTFICAPGFGVTFAGNFSAINGTIAADQLTFTGTAEGVVKGSVVGLQDVPTQIGGNVDIYVDRKDASPNPAGFVPVTKLVPVAASYKEQAGG